MKILASAAVLMLAGSAGLLEAQAPIQPGQLRTAARIAMPRPSSGVNARDAVRNTRLGTEENSHDRLMNRLWIASLFAVAGATSFDAASSWGKRESNPLLASGNGTFGARGLGIKVGLGAALIVPQICLRKHKEFRGDFAAGNFGGAAGFTAMAVHNLGVRPAATTQ